MNDVNAFGNDEQPSHWKPSPLPFFRPTRVSSSEPGSKPKGTGDGHATTAARTGTVHLRSREGTKNALPEATHGEAFQGGSETHSRL